MVREIASSTRYTEGSAARARVLPSGRGGTTLLEVLVALTLGFALVHLGLRTLEGVRETQRHLTSRQDFVASRRIVRTVLRGELAAARPEDWSVEGDSLVVRAFRGRAVVCGSPGGAGTLLVTYAGDREPSPSKDSLELVLEDGGLAYASLVSVRVTHERCAPDSFGDAAEWGIAPPPPSPPVLARPFESGSYGVTSNAFRFRRPGGGRQPLTPEVFRDDGSGLAVMGRAIRVSLTPATGIDGDPWDSFLAWGPQ